MPQQFKVNARMADDSIQTYLVSADSWENANATVTQALIEGGTKPLPRCVIVLIPGGRK